MMDNFTSLVTLISLIVLGPPLGRAVFRNPKGPLTQAIGTMVGISILPGVYGAVWSVKHRSIAWYAWLGQIPISGNVEVSGDISADVSEPLRVQVEP